MVVSQRKYILDIFEVIGMLDCKPVSTPMNPIVKFVPGPREISTPSREIELPHHHSPRHLLSSECS